MKFSDVNSAVSGHSCHSEPSSDPLRDALEHAAHLLPSQGPITVFVHHNTLHAFEHLPFDQAVREGWRQLGCQPYLSEERYRAKLARGRITAEDISQVLYDELGDDGDELLGFMGTRHHLRQAMLEYEWVQGTTEELEWSFVEADSLNRFRPEANADDQRRIVEAAKSWAADVRAGVERPGLPRGPVEALVGEFGGAPDSWTPRQWEAFTLELLWRVCGEGVALVPSEPPAAAPCVRHRDLLLNAGAGDADLLVNDVLVRLCSVFLDQGFARWAPPSRKDGLWAVFAAQYGQGRPAERWLRQAPAELARLKQAGATPKDILQRTLQDLGVPQDEWPEFLAQSALALRGWAGMVWQMETNASWTVRPAPAGAFVEFLAVRLFLDRCAVESLTARLWGAPVGAAEVRKRLRELPAANGQSRRAMKAHAVFRLAQVRGWTPADLQRLSPQEWSRLVKEIESFSDLDRRRVFQKAFERRYVQQTLGALRAHASRPSPPPRAPLSFQVITCIDDREESFRRHLEEIDPSCQTFGAPGFFAAPMYYRGAAEAYFRPLCPIVVTPKHYVREEPAYSLFFSGRQRAETRRSLGAATHQWHFQSRTFWGGMLTALLGSAASIPLVARILAPGLSSRLQRRFAGVVQPPPVTELELTRFEEPPGPQEGHYGFSLDEMTDSVERLLRDLGLTRTFAPLVCILGHGSSSLNNPHESAYNCGACSGGRGGPNARAFAQMANDVQVRRKLGARGVAIPEGTHFLGGYHNTCNDDIEFFDLDRLPVRLRPIFEASRAKLDEARARNAQERCRRFESAELSLAPDEALAHVQNRAEDLSQARPEYNHASCAVCVVGRRDRTRALFLDRRAFLCEYDPTQDDDRQTILSRILGAVIPVCAGISLEYYFSTVDTAGYGCGSKLPHNIVSLLGVMEGAAGDLRPGLSEQMVEIHEPLRILFVIEAPAESVVRIMDANPVIARLVRNNWVQLAVLDPSGPDVKLWRGDAFEPINGELPGLPRVASSAAWFQGRRDHLDFAVVSAEGPHSRPGGAA